MKHRASARYWDFYAELPEQIRKLADQNYELLKSDPHHPSLRSRKLDGFGPLASGFIIAPQPFRMGMISFGSGLVITANRIGFWALDNSEYFAR